MRRMTPIEHIRKSVFRLTQREFAEVVGVAQPTVSRWERGVPIASGEMSSIRSEAFARGIAWDDKWFFEVPGFEDNGALAEGRHVTVSPRDLPAAGCR